MFCNFAYNLDLYLFIFHKKKKHFYVPHAFWILQRESNQYESQYTCKKKTLVEKQRNSKINKVTVQALEDTAPLIITF